MLDELIVLVTDEGTRREGCGEEGEEVDGKRRMLGPRSSEVLAVLYTSCRMTRTLEEHVLDGVEGDRSGGVGRVRTGREGAVGVDIGAGLLESMPHSTCHRPPHEETDATASAA